MAGDVVDLIMQDHREIERLFGELTKHSDKRPNLTPALTTLLTAHSRAEEAEVYPVARVEAGAAEAVEDRWDEHARADRLLARLNETDPASATYDQILAELVEAVTHHVREEEAGVLPQIRDRLGEQRRADLGVAFLRHRGEHLGRPAGPPAPLTRSCRVVGPAA